MRLISRGRGRVNKLPRAVAAIRQAVSKSRSKNTPRPLLPSDEKTAARGDVRGQVDVERQLAFALRADGHIGIDVVRQIAPGAHRGVAFLIGLKVEVIQPQPLADVRQKTAIGAPPRQ